MEMEYDSFSPPKVIISMDEWKHYQDMLAEMKQKNVEVDALKAYIDQIYEADGY